MAFTKYAVYFTDGMIDNFQTFFNKSEANEFYQKVKQEYNVAKLLQIIEE